MKTNSEATVEHASDASDSGDNALQNKALGPAHNLNLLETTINELLVIIENKS